MLNWDIEREVDAKFRDYFKGKDTIIDFLVKHPLKKELISKLVDEVKNAQLRVPRLANWDSIKQISHDFAMIFAKQAIMAKEKDFLSDFALVKAKKEIDDFNYIMDNLKNADTAGDEDVLDTESRRV
jgi:hypothetical protein